MTRDMKRKFSPRSILSKSSMRPNSDGIEPVKELSPSPMPFKNSIFPNSEGIGPVKSFEPKSIL